MTSLAETSCAANSSADVAIASPSIVIPEPPLEVPVPKPPAITEIKFLFMARHIMYERIAPELPTNAPITMSKSLESINPSAAAAHPE